MTGSTTITANISEAQMKAGEKLQDHSLEYIQIGSYMEHGTSFTLSATNQTIENALCQFLEDGTDGIQTYIGLDNEYTGAGEALDYLINSCANFWYSYVSGSTPPAVSTDFVFHCLASYLWYQMIESAGSMAPIGIPASDFQKVTWGTTATDTSGTFDLPNPGVYLIIDTTDSGNASLPIILFTKPLQGYVPSYIPSSMTNYFTNTITLKSQGDAVTQFVTDPTTNASGDLTGGNLTGTMSATIGAQNVITVQLSDVFPQGNQPNYCSDNYCFNVPLSSGITFNTAKGQNMYVAGIPLATLVADGDATVSVTTATESGTVGTTTVYGSQSGHEELKAMPNLVGGQGAELEVSLNEAGMQYIAAHGTIVNPASTGGLFEINGLADDGTYTVTEAHAATGADQSVLPSFTITLKSGAPEVISLIPGDKGSLNLVNNTPNGNPFNSTDYNTVENVKSLTGQIPTGSGQIPSGLPLTGGAGILTGVIAAVILFAAAGIVLVVYRRRKQQED